MKCVKLSQNLERAREELACGKQSLNIMVAEKHSLQKSSITSEKKIAKTTDVCKSTLNHVEEELVEKNEMLSEKLASLEPKSFTSVPAAFSTMIVNFVLQTKTDKHYSDSIRQLYYSLLADQIPPAKIEEIIKSVLCHHWTFGTLSYHRKNVPAI